MQLPWLAVCAPPVIVVHPVGHIAVLLNFGDQCALADGVHRARFNKEYITLVNIHMVEHLWQRVVLNGGFECFLADLLLKAIDQLGAGGCVQYIPHLGLAEFVLHTAGIVVIRVHLNRQVVLGINQLNEHRKIGESGGVGAAKRFFAHGLYHLLQRLTVIAAAVDGVHTRLVAGQHPALCQFGQVTLEPKVLSQALTAPYIILKDGL